MYMHMHMFMHGPAVTCSYIQLHAVIVIDFKMREKFCSNSFLAILWRDCSFRSMLSGPNYIVLSHSEESKSVGELLYGK